MDNETKKLLEDYNAEFIKFRRNVEDALENIDLDNLTPRVRSFITGSGTAGAGFETGSVSDGAYARMFAEFKNAREKAFAEFKAEVASTYATLEMLTEYETETNKSIADIKSAADENKASISSITEWQNTPTGPIFDLETAVDNAKESIAGITQRANASGAFIDIFAIAGNGTLKKDTDGNYVTTSDGEYIFVKNGEETPISQADVAGLFFSELNNGESEIKLKADRIRLGDGAGVDENGNLYFCRLFGPSDVVSGNCPGQFYLEIDSNFGFTENSVGADMLMKSVSSIDSYTGNEAVMYGFRYGSTKGNEGTSSVNFVVATDAAGGEKSIIGYNYNQDKVYPKGTWDFSSSEVSGLAVYFS